MKIFTTCALLVASGTVSCVFAQTPRTAMPKPIPVGVPASTAPRAFAPVEAAFRLPELKGDPFDFVQNDVRAQIRQPNGKILSLPAFFDGDATWRVRHTPDAPGAYALVSLTHNGAALNVDPTPRIWKVQGQAVAGFVRLDPRGNARFARGNAPYYPLGHNQAWRTNGLPDIPALFDKMGAAGENWSRVWMNHWDGKNLDWLPDGRKPGEFGTLDLGVARRWDSIVQSAQKNGIAFQMVFQHHGQYSSSVNPNWPDNPYNAKNGGFLNAPEEFFTSPRARELTKRKLRYCVARWGYSPSICAWELWNEVQFSDAGRGGKWDDVAKWHTEMAAFLRAQDLYKHLVTTSSSESIPASVWQNMDYGQEHLYPADVVSAVGRGNHQAESPRTKPGFVGEFGPSGVNDPQGVALHAGLWSGILSGEAGAPAFWTWDDVERGDLYFHFAAASGFVRASNFSSCQGLKRMTFSPSTSERGELGFGPGGDWGQTKQFEFLVTPDGAPEGMSSLPRYLQGEANRQLQPQPLKFKVSFVNGGQFGVELSEISKTGAHVQLSVDGQVLAERDFPATTENARLSGDGARLSVAVPSGNHVVTLENTGGDWAAVSRFTLSDYAPTLAARALSGRDFYAAWIYHRANLMAPPDAALKASSGRFPLTGLRPGRFRATWWNTREGRVIGASDLRIRAGLPHPTLSSPPVERDVALFVVPLS